MASWLKAAEDLFEVVDRRAKLVVSEISDEQSVSQSPASDGQGSQTKGTKSRKKVQKRLSKKEAPKTNDKEKEESATNTHQSDASSQKNESSSVDESRVFVPDKPVNQENEEQQDSALKESSPEIATQDLEKDGADNAGVQSEVTDEGGVTSKSNGDVVEKKVLVQEERPPSPVTGAGIESVSEDHVTDAPPNLKPGDLDIHSKEVEISQSATSTSIDDESQVKTTDTKAETSVDEGRQLEQKAEKVQEQLNEAQGLLQTAVSTGQSKEARLARVCAGLSTRLQEYKSENAQLEELLTAERELSKSFEVQIKQLQQELSASKSEVTRIESSMDEALAAKNSEIETLRNSLDSLKKQAALSEGNIASLQANMESIMRNRELTETRMIQALREELASVERRAEEERTAHHATKMAAMEREVELEHRAVEASTALARIQRIADERTAKATELEQKVALLEVECASLNQELQDMETRARRLEKKTPEDTNQVNQAWREEVERAREGQRDAERKLSSVEAEMQKLRVEMAAMKRDAEHYSRQEHMELEKRYRELTDLLYYKQTQLETMASEKAAAEFQLEKELKRLKEAQVEAERSRVSRRPSTTWEEDTEMKALEPLPLHHRHMAAASIQLQKAAKLLDSGAVRATRFLWRYPTARLSLLFYLVFVHLFLMYLLHRLQEKADSNAARELADAMGLQTQNLP